MSLLEHPYFVGVGCFVTGSLLGYWLLWWKDRNVQAALSIKRQNLLDEARRQGENIVREAQLRANENSLKVRTEIENSFAPRRQELNQSEHQLNEREALINRQLESLVREEATLRRQLQDCEKQNKELNCHRRELTELTERRQNELHQLAHLSEAEARALVLKEAEQAALRDASILSRRILEETKTHAEEKARQIVSIAIQRYAGDQTFETTSATVTLPNEELKGRIIGREGRNIRAFEAATGVTVLIDDTPNAVVLSGFDPVRREVARESMQRLILDGRIHPTRIEEIVTKVAQEMEETIMRAGEEAVFKAGLPPMHPEIVKVLGRLRFRHSFSQNILHHSVEVAHLMGLMAGEMGLPIDVAKRCGLLHDIGKAINHEVEGAHALIGADLLRRFGEQEDVANAVAAHHDEAPHHGPLGILVGAADAISASRPGARSETMTTYIKRVEDLERLALSFMGVEKCFAVQAGRELRVLVQPEMVSDEAAYALARDISRKIENEMQYPGQIRVTVVRETRCIEFAK